MGHLPSSGRPSRPSSRCWAATRPAPWGGAGGRRANYQCVVPTTLNASPRDDRDQPGPVEQALQGVKVRDEENPFELVRIVRSFDPCIACAVHLVTPKGRSLGEFRVF